MSYDETKALNYLIDQHKHCQALMDDYSSPGKGRPAFVRNYLERLSSLDQAIAAFSGRAALRERE
ncbi:hypothetical protein [Brucella intermedia]|uniref:hypothetical protein n=1 Tax=Brucella intermedia TaxID=94625 RepID=UPI00124F0A80|nr:hypothetical protein [Brucella intermedia]KAB2693358.1 hypothetical protein F9K72_17990 [Brucella intermedia]